MKNEYTLTLLFRAFTLIISFLLVSFETFSQAPANTNLPSETEKTATENVRLQKAKADSIMHHHARILYLTPPPNNSVSEAENAPIEKSSDNAPKQVIAAPKK